MSSEKVQEPKLGNLKQKASKIYAKAYQMLGEGLNKTKQTTNSAYTNIKQKTPHLIDQTKEKSKQIYQKSKQVSSNSYNHVKTGVLRLTEQYGPAASQYVKKNWVNIVIYLYRSAQRIATAGDQDLNLGQRIIKKYLDDIVKNSIYGSLTHLGISEIISLIGFSNFGISTFSWSALMQSQIGSLTAQSLFTCMQAITAKAFITAYAPIVVPTAVVTYAGYQVYVNVVEQKKPSKIITTKEKRINEGQASQIESGGNKGPQIELQSLHDWLQKNKFESAHPDATL